MRVIVAILWMGFVGHLWNAVIGNPEGAGEWFAKARAQYLIVTSR